MSEIEEAIRQLKLNREETSDSEMALLLDECIAIAEEYLTKNIGGENDAGEG